ncbi:16S rRNA (guanine(527)-N(7))-methyltransferase RsmG [Paenibacillus antri]|uniref:Ribosomal RNA small subunit methyltransferase G n=1 Tax=Paenibacillus antri TaxID=2582848 RepID=A0A5R9G803_9BACL|nr:16S rRNA (guanine(527)-N(7))-methyltransferase RsmG [Paenibacillus antri]TLS48873.1 16S rRNA (guanine(527)-N(7))-methyltransferase RsmG [Paenibacillus antri]
MSDPRETFRGLLAERGIAVTERQLEQFEIYYRELVEWNEKMNLTGITEKEQVYIKHFYDSISLSFFHPLDDVRSIADIGSGAGFPSIPLKIAFPHLRVTIVDSLQKRIGFLRHLVERLGVNDVDCVHARAEDAARLEAHRDRYDVVTARAVARLNVLSEFCLPFVRPQGVFIAMKGSDPGEELKEAAFAFKELGGAVESDFAFELPMEQSGRHVIVVRKTKATPGKYPRKPGVPLKMPLLGAR